MKRSITMLAVTLATAAALAGCGKKETPPAATTEAPPAAATQAPPAPAPAADPGAPAADPAAPPAGTNTTDRPSGGGEKL